MTNKLLTQLSSLLLPLGLYGLPAQAGGNYQRDYQRSYLGAAIHDSIYTGANPEPARLQSFSEVEDLTLLSPGPVRELVVIDSAVPDKHVFYRDVKPGVDIVEIDATRPGLPQLMEILGHYQNLKALHIVSHAEDGAVLLGDSRIDAEAVKQEIELFASLNGALEEGGDLLFYGCDLAAGESGAELLDILQDNTHLDIAASSDLTGAATQAGDWELEIRRGQIQSALPFSSKALADFSAVLGNFVLQDFSHERDCQSNGSAPSYSYYSLKSGNYTGCGFMGLDNGVGNGHFGGDVTSVSLNNFFNGSSPAYLADSTNLADSTSGTNAIEIKSTQAFQLTGLATSEFEPNPSWSNGYKFSNVHVVGYKSGGGTVTSSAFNHDTQGATTQLLFGASELADFAGVNLTRFRLMFRNEDNTWSSGMQLVSFDTAVSDITAPTISAVADQQLGVDDNTGELAVTVGDSYTPNADIILTRSSSNTTVVPLANVVLGGSGANRTVTVTAAQAGTSTITLTATDRAGNVATETFDVEATALPKPTVTADNISVSGGSGTDGAFRIGDELTITWDNTALGDNNADVSQVSIDVSDMNGGTQQPAANQDDIWTLTWFPADDHEIDLENVNIKVNAENAAGVTTTSDDTNFTIDNVAPIVSDSHLSISGGTGPDGVYRIGDTVSVTWNDTASGDNNADTITGATVDFSAFGGGSAVVASNSSDTWIATYKLTDGGIEADNRNIAVTTMDDAGNATTVADTSNATVDTLAPAVTSVTVPANGTYLLGDNLDLTVNINQSVYFIGTPRIALTVGGITRFAMYESGYGTDVLTFRYTIQSGDLDTDGVAIDGTIDRNDSVPIDSNYNMFVPTLESIGSTAGVHVDATIPTLQSLSPADDSGFVGAGADFVLTLSESIALGSGNIVIYNSADIAVASIDVDSHGGQLSIDGAELTIDPLADLAENDSYYIQVANGAITDLAGNVYNGILDAVTWNFTVPDIAPPAVTGIALNDTPAPSDAELNYTVSFSELVNGVSKDDFSLTTTGTAAGTIAEVSAVTGSSIDVTVTDVSGTGSLRLDLNANTNLTDNSGNGNGTNGYVQAFTAAAVHAVDREAPATPGAPDLAAGSDTGSSSADNITSDVTPTLTGNTEANAIVSISSDQDGVLGTVNADGSGAWSFTPAGLTANLNHTLTVRAADTTGNMSEQSPSLSLLIDTSAPDAPSAPDLIAGSDSGSSTVDNLTRDRSPTITGTAEANSTVSVTSGAAGLLGKTTTDGSGHWSFTPATDLGAGAHTLTSVASDAAGNTSAASEALSVTIDTAAPAISAVAFGDPIDALTQNSVEFSLTGAEVGATASYTITTDGGGTEVTGTQTVTADQSLGPIDLSSLADGALTVSLVLTDAAGNAAAAVSDTVTKDTAIPAVVLVEIPDGDYRAGEVLSVTVSLDEDVTVSGTASTVAIDVGENSRSASFSSEVDGMLTYVYTVQDGDNTTAVGTAVSANGLALNGDTVVDSSGNAAELSFAATGNVDAQVDTLAPVAPSIPDLATGSDTGGSDTDNITSSTTPTLIGTAEAYSTVTLNTGGASDTTTADASGDWSYTSPALIDATHDVTVFATDAAGNDSPVSDSLALTIDSSAPALAAVAFADNIDGLNQHDVVFSLTGAEIGATANYVVISDSSSVEVTSTEIVTADQALGPIDLAGLGDGTLTISVALTDTAGNSSATVTDTATKDANPVLILPMDPDPMVDGSNVKVPGVTIGGTLRPSIHVDLAVATGALAVDTESGAAVSDNVSGNVSISGSVAQVNAALAGLSYDAAVNMTGLQALQITVDDGAGTASGTIDFAVNDRPDISALDGTTVTYNRGSQPVRLDVDSEVIVSDLDSPHFDGGSLTVSITTGGDELQDLLSLDTRSDEGNDNEGDVTLGDTVAGSEVRVEDIVIGTLSHDITEGADLVVSFNVDATPARVSVLLQALTYHNTNSKNAILGNRRVEISLDDGETQRDVSLTVNVKVPPVTETRIDTETDGGTYNGGITVTETGVLNGGTANGSINNSGTLTGDIKLGASGSINGGTVSAKVSGTATRPAPINGATITGGASLQNVVISSDSVLEPGVGIGPNVRFASGANIPAGLELTAALRSLNWLSGDERPAVILDGDVLSVTSSQDPMSILRAIQLLDDFEPSGNQTTQDSNTGEILVESGDFNASVLPVQVSQAAPDEEEGVYINEDGDIVFVATNRRVVLSHPVLAADSGFEDTAATLGLALSFDERANLVLSEQNNPASNFYYTGRPELVAIPAHRGSAAGLYTYAAPGLANVEGLSIVFETEGGELMEQEVVPVPSDWLSFKSALQTAGLSDVRIDTQGIVHVRDGNTVIRGRVDYSVQRGPSVAGAKLAWEAAGDLNGDGADDVLLIYPNGDRQVLYIYP